MTVDCCICIGLLADNPFNPSRPRKLQSISILTGRFQISTLYKILQLFFILTCSVENYSENEDIPENLDDQVTTEVYKAKNNPLPKVTNLVDVVKNFYAECPQVQQRTDEEVVQWRQEKQVRVQGTMQIKPILSFNEIQLPPILLDIIHRKLSLTSLFRLLPPLFRLILTGSDFHWVFIA